jgi:hypothetical protein
VSGVGGSGASSGDWPQPEAAAFADALNVARRWEAESADETLDLGARYAAWLRADAAYTILAKIGTTAGRRGG